MACRRPADGLPTDYRRLPTTTDGLPTDYRRLPTTTDDYRRTTDELPTTTDDYRRKMGLTKILFQTISWWKPLNLRQNLATCSAQEQHDWSYHPPTTTTLFCCPQLPPGPEHLSIDITDSCPCNNCSVGFVSLLKWGLQSNAR